MVGLLVGLPRGWPPPKPGFGSPGSPSGDGLVTAGGGSPAIGCSVSGGLGEGFDTAVLFALFHKV